MFGFGAHPRQAHFDFVSPSNRSDHKIVYYSPKIYDFKYFAKNEFMEIYAYFVLCSWFLVSLLKYSAWICACRERLILFIFPSFFCRGSNPVLISSPPELAGMTLESRLVSYDWENQFDKFQQVTRRGSFKPLCWGAKNHLVPVSFMHFPNLYRCLDLSFMAADNLVGLTSNLKGFYEGFEFRNP